LTPSQLSGKCKVVTVQTTKVYRGSRGTVPLIFNVGTRWPKAPAVLPTEENAPLHQSLHNRRLGGPHSRCGRFGKEKNLSSCQLKLTPWSKVLLKKIIVVHLVKTLNAICVTQMFITVSHPTS
jgi:hypothetical protein